MFSLKSISSANGRTMKSKIGTTDTASMSRTENLILMTVSHQVICIFFIENRSSYAACISDDYTKWEIDKEKAEFERAATQKSAITEIMKNRFKRAQFQDKEENVSLSRSKREKMYQVILLMKGMEKHLKEKIDAVKMNFFGAMTHECYDWYPSKIVCRRFNVPEPYPGSTQLGCPWLEAENK